jgi:hypothetical protein
VIVAAVDIAEHGSVEKLAFLINASEVKHATSQLRQPGWFKIQEIIKVTFVVNTSKVNNISAIGKETTDSYC